jgi:hypothetical protein
MDRWSAWIGVLLVLSALVDRLLLRMESKGWIHYRRSRLGRGVGLYHLLRIHSIYDPSVSQVIEAKYGEQEVEEEESGEPPEPGDGRGRIRQ